MGRRSTDTASELSTLMMFSPMVFLDRMTEFWMTAHAPSDKAKRESIEMVTEKLEAASESFLAMNMAIAQLTVEGMTAAMTGRQRDMGNDVDVVMAAGLKPYSKRVRANSRRLSK